MQSRGVPRRIEDPRFKGLVAGEVKRRRLTAYSSQITAARAARLVSSDGKRDLAQDWRPVREQEQRLDRGLGQGQ